MVINSFSVKLRWIHLKDRFQKDQRVFTQPQASFRFRSSNMASGPSHASHNQYGSGDDLIDPDDGNNLSEVLDNR